MPLPTPSFSDRTAFARIAPRLLALAAVAAVPAAFLTACGPHAGEFSKRRAVGTLAELNLGEDGEREEFDIAPPKGYIRITGEPVPDWEPGMTPRAATLKWQFLGPRPILFEYWSGFDNAGGRVVSIAPHPLEPDICYIATASGGVWKTIDGGATWTPISDELSILNSGFITIDPSNPDTIYYGTGEWGTQSTGDGVFKSIDGGVTWERLVRSNVVGGQVLGIAVDPFNPLVIHVVGTGGYNRTEDGGVTWINEMTGVCTGLALAPLAPNIIHVAKFADGVYRSTDGGNNLTKLASGFPAPGTFDTVEIAMSASNPNKVYAVACNGGGSRLYVLPAANSGWNEIAPAKDFVAPQGDYNILLAIDPTNDNILYHGGVDPRYANTGVKKSTNGGGTWTEISASQVFGQLHPDHQCMAFGPTGVIWAGNDGGVWKSEDNGTSWINTNATLGATQLYHAAVHPANPTLVLGGTQDNGTPQRTEDSEGWPQVQTGDGGFSVYDPTDPNTFYTTYVFLTVTRWTPFGSADINGPWGSDPANFIAPLVGDPSRPKALLGGTNRIWRTLDATAGSVEWTDISTSIVSSGTTINAIAVAPSAPNTIYSGSRNGKVWRTINAKDWEERSTGLPSGQISDIVVSPFDPETAYVGYYNVSGGRLWKTVDGGKTWTDATGTLRPGVAVRALAIDWDKPTDIKPIIIGSGAGIWATFDDGLTWEKDAEDFPNVNVGDLAIDRGSRTITAGTYGRGAWRASLDGCLADFNLDGFVDAIDYDLFIAAWVSGSLDADINNDQFIDAIDYDVFIAAWVGTC